MHEWVSNGKMYLDQVIEDLQFVRDNYVKGAKQDEAHFASKHIIEIASILHNDRYFRRVFPLNRQSEKTSRILNRFSTKSSSVSPAFSKGE